MKPNVHVWLSTLIMGAAILLFPACEETIGGAGRDVLPDDDLISLKFTDTISVQLETNQLDQTNTYRIGRELFGNYIDPEFGRMQAATYTQVLPRSGLDFGDPADLQLDSLVLTMDLESAYGRLQSLQTLMIHELTESVPEGAGTEVFSNTSLKFDASKNLANGRILDFSGESGVGFIRVRLDNSLGMKLLFANADTLGDRALFNQFFKGFYISTKPVTYLSREPGAIFTLFGSSSLTQLSLHYKKRDASTGEFVENLEPFLITSSTPRFHQITRTEVENKLLSTELSSPDTSKQFEFVQGGALIKLFLKFPHLDRLDPIGVSRARLVLPVDEERFGSEDRFRPPTSLLVLEANEDKEELLGENGNVIPISASFPDVIFDSSSDAYVLDLTDYIQQVINGQRANNGIILRPVTAGRQVNRAVLGGVNHPTLNPVLELTYSTLPR